MRIPVRVDFIPADVLPVRGRLGMTRCPGTGRNGSLENDLRSIREDHRAEVMVNLLADAEMRWHNVPQLPERVLALGMEVLRYPIIDREVPRDQTGFRVLMTQVAMRLHAGRAVVVHCRAGLGRTGTAVACMLVRMGAEPQEAIGATRRVRPGTIETDDQEAFVRRFR